VYLKIYPFNKPDFKTGYAYTKTPSQQTEPGS
jgi:hypothetical protein